MVKIRVYFDNDAELSELIKLLSPRLNYIKKIPDSNPRRCYLGIETADLMHDLVNENADEASKLAAIMDDTPYAERRDD